MGPAVPVAQVRSAVRAVLPDIADHHIFVACSGGADSLALAAATVFETRRRGRVGLVTVDHGVQAGSAEQASRVASIGYELGFDPVIALAVSVESGSAAGGPEAAARTARYRALGEVAHAYDARILLGHTLDDQAETVLLGLGRGSGPRSIAGMRAVSSPYVRPFLGIRRATTVAACDALGLLPWHDPQNDDPAFERVRLRRLLPELESALQGGVVESLARTASLLQDDLDALDELAELAETSLQALERSELRGLDAPGLPVEKLTGHPPAIRTRMIRRWASRHATSLTAGHIAAMDALVMQWHGQGPVDLPGGYFVIRASGRLSILPRKREE